MLKEKKKNKENRVPYVKIITTTVGGRKSWMEVY